MAGRRRLLIVEDDLSTLTLIATRFSRRGWGVCGAATVAEGMEGLNPPPDCLILDLNLPDGRGEAILERIRGHDIPVLVVIVVTGHPESDRLSLVAAMAPDLTIMKPFDWDVVLRYCESTIGPD